MYWFLNFLYLTNRKLQQLHNAKVRQHVRTGDRCTLEVTLNGGGKAGHLEWILGFRHEPKTISKQCPYRAAMPFFNVHEIKLHEFLHYNSV